uniref:Alanine--glyoxylate aminotransferase 2, mitochondrial n=1 Tax=Heterorhabditis bacteriophora TaxID=37862 RepID=A0A1I7XNP6_HETBA
MQRIEQLKSFIPKSTVVFYKKPLLITRGNMQFLYDSDGKKYLDMFAGIVTVSVGHCHPKVNEALKGQLDRLWHTTSIYYTEPVLEYAEMLTATLPEHLKLYEPIRGDSSTRLSRRHWPCRISCRVYSRSRGDHSIHKRVIEEEKLQENCSIIGEYFIRQLSSIDSKLIGDVRGKKRRKNSIY